MLVSQLSEKVHAERIKNPPVMIEGKTTDQAMQKIRCMLNKNVSLAIPLDSLLSVYSRMEKMVNVVFFQFVQLCG